MSLTFKDVQASEAEASLLNASEYAQSITHTHPDNGNETIVAIFDEDALDLGQPSPTTAAGTKVKQRALLEVLSSVSIVEERPTGYPSKFTIGSEVWIAKRIVGKDSATQTVEIHRVDQKATKRPQ